MPNKPRTKKTAKKLAKKTASSLDSILDKPAPKETPEPNPDCITPVVTIPESTQAPFTEAELEEDPTTGTFHGLFEPEDFDPYAPGNQSSSSLEQLPEAAEGPGGDVPLDQPVPLPLASAQEAFFPLPAAHEPVAAPPVAHSPETTTKPVETPPDALIVERLLNAINYLFPIAKLTKGARGPQPKELSLIAANMKLARQLVERIK